MSISKPFIGASLLAACLAVPARADLTLGQTDTFEDGTTQGWTAGGVIPGTVVPVPPTNIPTGGPAGVGDHYLQLTALGGAGPGSRLSAFNLSQWAGNYLAAGITAISLDANNFGPSDASLRLLISDPMAGPPNDEVITNAVLVRAGSGWTPITFSLDPASLTTLLGDATTALSHATELRIIHNPDATFPPPPVGPPAVNLVLGVDNILATQSVVPEPSSAVLAGIGLLALFIRSRMSGRSRAVAR